MLLPHDDDQQRDAQRALSTELMLPLPNLF
jgi:hypothetical protein